MRKFEPDMTEEIDTFLQQLIKSSSNPQKALDMSKACQYLGFDIIGRLGFGTALALQTAERKSFHGNRIGRHELSSKYLHPISTAEEDWFGCPTLPFRSDQSDEISHGFDEHRTCTPSRRQRCKERLVLLCGRYQRSRDRRGDATEGNMVRSSLFDSSRYVPS